MQVNKNVAGVMLGIPPSILAGKIPGFSAQSAVKFIPQGGVKRRGHIIVDGEKYSSVRAACRAHCPEKVLFETYYTRALTHSIDDAMNYYKKPLRASSKAQRVTYKGVRYKSIKDAARALCPPDCSKSHFSKLIAKFGIVECMKRVDIKEQQR